VKLCVSYNQLTNLPESLRQLRQLASLDVAYNRLADVPVGTWDLPITKLELAGNLLQPELTAEMSAAAAERFARQPLGLRMSSPVEAARAAKRESQKRKEIAESLKPKSAVEIWLAQHRKDPPVG